MNVREAIRSSLALLTSRDRRRLLLATGINMSTAFLDLVGVLLIGLLGVLAAGLLQSQPEPAWLREAAVRVGMGGLTTTSLVGTIALTAAVVLLLKSMISTILTRRVLRFLAGRQAQVSGALTRLLLTRSLLVVQARPSQEVAYALVTGVTLATITLLGSSVTAATEIAVLVVLGCGLMVLDPLLTIMTIIFFALVALVLQRILAPWASRMGALASSSDIESYIAIQEVLANYREITVADRRGHYAQRLQDLRWHASTALANLQFLGQIPKYVFESALVLGGLLLAGSQFYFKDAAAAIGSIALFLAAASRIMPSIMRLQGASIMIRTASSGAALTYSLASELDLAAFQGKHMPAGKASATLPGRDAGFSPDLVATLVAVTYPGGSTPALTDATLTVAAGTSVALVGPTGAGKSTLADIILGVVEPDEGQVLVGGVPPAEAVRRWPGALAYVSQDVSLANGDVRQNVALGLPIPDIDDDRVWEALERAHLASFLRSTREGLDTLVGERGVRLSGGQRQRLGLARALYTRPQFLVLDEATSALDAETEQAISQTLQAMAGTVTTVTVAHRLATVQHADLVVYLEHGRILAQGTFDEVRAAVPSFENQARLLGL